MSSFSVRTSADGSRIVAPEQKLGAYPQTVCEDLVAWAGRRPDATFLAERRGDGWRRLSYHEALERARSIGTGLLRSGASQDAPLGVIADNGIDHALVALAAMYVGIPVSPISVGYAAPEASPSRLREMLATLGAGVVYAGNAAIAHRYGTGRVRRRKRAFGCRLCARERGHDCQDHVHVRLDGRAERRRDDAPDAVRESGDARDRVA
jgi:long-subunit acyl-CoA synthetase (AMP-forming)